MQGLYILEIHVELAQTLRVGALGERTFAQGMYVYIGSAQRGLEHRVARHARREKRLRWHIDYLLTAPGVHLRRVFIAPGDKRQECVLAHRLARLGQPIRNFGSSDCSCPGHLFHVTRRAWCPQTMPGLRLFSFPTV